MSLRDWKLVDAGLDNIGSTNREAWTESSDPDRAARADRIRRVGWSVTESLEEPSLAAGTWPPDERTMATPVTVALPEDDWRFVLDGLDAEDTRGTTSDDRVQYGRVATIILDALASH